MGFLYFPTHMQWCPDLEPLVNFPALRVNLLFSFPSRKLILSPITLLYLLNFDEISISYVSFLLLTLLCKILGQSLIENTML